LVEAALADGTVAPDVDPEAVLFFVQTMHLGMLLQQAAGAARPDQRSWEDLVARIVASFGRETEAGEPSVSATRTSTRREPTR
jgi:hypothetical protein